jgi:hypothetical protein
MGRPLKIAKAQTVLTITDTVAATGVVTVSQTLATVGVSKGMSFVTASTVGGLTANTIYYILAVTGASTFTVSSTQLSVQPQVSPTLSDTTGQSVRASVNVVDAYFNNPLGGAGFPATNANTYGVVGGNTTIVGKQVLCNVAFGVQGTGTQLASTSSNVLVGLGTNFANIANGTIIFAQYGTTGYGANVVPGTGAVTLIGTVANNVGNVTVAVANSTATGNVIRTSGNAQTLVLGGAVTFDTAFGGLTASTPYFVKTIANATAFTVSATPGGAAQAITSNASVTSNAIQQQLVLTAVAANNSTGVSGAGDTFIQALPEAGYIVRQKGKTKYLVTGTVTGITNPVYTANVANTALTPNTMTIIATNAASGTQYVASINDYNSELFPATVAPGSLSVGTLYTIYQSGTTDWTACGAASNITGITFTATATGSGTGLAVLNTVNPDVIASFNTAYAANAANGQPNPIVTINNA